MVAWTRAVVLNMERGGKKCILEVDPMEYANMGLREKEESITSPRFFFFYRSHLDGPWCHFWGEGGWRWERFKRGIKSSVLHMLDLRFRWDKRRYEAGSLTQEQTTHGSLPWFLRMLFKSDPISKVFPEHPIRNSQPNPFYPASLAFCFLLLRSPYYHLTRCLHFRSLPISPPQDYSPPCGHGSCPFGSLLYPHQHT